MIKLSSHFTLKKLYRFVMPSVIMMIFTSIYSVVDGYFVSNYAGKTEFASLNFVFPLLMILGAFGFMMGTGGSAIVAKTLGEGDRERANRYFSLITYATIALSVVVTVVGVFAVRPVVVALGAGEAMVEHCVTYGTIMILGLPAFMLQNMFQSFFVTAEKAKTGLWVTVAAGCTNIVGDAVLVGLLDLGLVGAALASVLGQTVAAVYPLVYFSSKNGSLLRLGRTKVEWKVLFHTCTNGSSELLSNLASSIVGMLFNAQLMRVAGENGLSAYGVLMYVNFIYAAIFFGYAIGSSPIISYNYGADNRQELTNLYRKSVLTMSVVGVAMAVLAVVLADPLARLFVGYSEELVQMTKVGFFFCSACFVVMGMNVFGSAFFTALNNGGISALLSFLRTLIFQVIAVLVLPELISPAINGIWLSAVVAELLSFVVTVLCLILYRKRYGYSLFKQKDESPKTI